MQKFKEVIRLKTAGLSLRPIAAAVRLSLGTVAKYAKAAEVAGSPGPCPWTGVMQHWHGCYRSRLLRLLLRLL